MAFTILFSTVFIQYYQITAKNGGFILIVEIVLAIIYLVYLVGYAWSAPGFIQKKLNVEESEEEDTDDEDEYDSYWI